MLGDFDKFFLKIGFWFGNLIVNFLETIFPNLKDKDENLHGIKDYYLQGLNISNKERFKRNLKLATRIYFSILFWVFFTYALFGLIFSSFNFGLLVAFGIFSFILFGLILIAAFKISKK